MRLLLLTLSILALPFVSPGQIKEISALDRETIKKNKVYKCLEFNYHDSVSFFKNYRNGLYTIFDTQGRVIEENTYSSGIVDEIKVIYSYDKLGRKNMWFWYQANSVPKISRARIEKYDSLGRNIGYCEYSPGGNERCETYVSQINVTDTITFNGKTSKRLVYLTFSDPTRKDTVYKDTYLFQKDQLDSNILIRYEQGRVLEKLVKRHFYTEGLINRSEFTRYYEGQRTETNSMYYHKTGLPDRIESIRYYFETKSSKPRIDKDFRKFVYTFWK